MPFPDLLQWIGDTRRSGAITVSLSFDERRFLIERGQIVALGSPDPRADDLGRLLLAKRLIDERTLHDVVAQGLPRGKTLRDALVERKVIEADRIDAAVRAHARDVILQIFLWDGGRFVFFDASEHSLLADDELDLRVEPPVSVSEALMDGMRQLDEWQRVSEVLPSDFTIVHALGRADDLPALAFLADAGQPQAIGDLYLRMGRPRFEVVRELYEAWRRELLAIESTPRELMRPAGADPASVLLSNARALLEARQYDEAATLLRSVLDLDPFRDEARQLLGDAHSAQLAELYQQFPPYRVPVVSRPRPPDELVLTSRERYLLQRIDGSRDIGLLTVITPLGESEVLRTLKKFHHIGLISFT